MILDEVDALLTSNSSHNANNNLRNLFTLPSTFTNTTIRVIAISNSLDLTARRSIASALGELAPDVLAFGSYGSKEMIEIVRSRVQGVKQDAERDGLQVVHLEDKAIELVGRKVEASNGDLRMCLNVLVDAVGATEKEWKQRCGQAGPGSPPVPLLNVTLTQVLKALTSSITKLKANAASSGPTGGAGSGQLVSKVQSLSVHVRSILLALLVARHRISLDLRPAHAPASNEAYHHSATTASTNSPSSERVTLESLLATYTYMLNHVQSCLPPVGHSDFMDLIMQAEVIGLVSLDKPLNASASGDSMTPSKSSTRRKTGKSREQRPIDLNVKDADLLAALGIGRPASAAQQQQGGQAGAVMESEIRAMWAREEARWTKALAGRTRATHDALRRAERGQVGFDDD